MFRKTHARHVRTLAVLLMLFAVPAFVFAGGSKEAAASTAGPKKGKFLSLQLDARVEHDSAHHGL